MSGTRWQNNHVSQDHAKYATKLFDSGLFSDCVIRSQNRSWHLHRAILAQRCEFFKACFSDGFLESLPRSAGGVVEVDMHEDDPEALERMLNWLYTMEYPTIFDVNASNVKLNENASNTNVDVDLLETAQRADLPDTFWTSEMSLFILADKYDLPDLATAASASICSTITALPINLPLPHDPISEKNQLLPSPTAANFITALESLYTNLAPSSRNVRSFRENLFRAATIPIAELFTAGDQQLEELLCLSPEFAMDLIAALKREALQARKAVGGECQHGDGKCEGDVMSVVAPSPVKIYIPMNEDSDVDD